MNVNWNKIIGLVVALIWFLLGGVYLFEADKSAARECMTVALLFLIMVRLEDRNP